MIGFIQKPSAQIQKWLQELKTFSKRLAFTYSNKLAIPEQGLVIIAALIFPTHLVSGQLYSLFTSIGELISGNKASYLPFFLVLVNASATFYAVRLLYSRWGSEEPVKDHPVSGNDFFKISYVPKHLLEVRPERAPGDFEVTDEDLMGLNLTSPAVIEQMPKALEILRNSASTLDMYKHHHPESESQEENQNPTKSLLDILHESRFPPIDSEDDLNRIQQS